MAEYKQLTPAKFKLNDEKEYTADRLYNIVLAGLESSTFREYFKTSGRKSMAIDMLKKANNPKSGLDANVVGVAGQHDLSALLKDFGEITGALYMLRTRRNVYTHVVFPKDENNPLGDYFLITNDGFRQPVSAKAQAGSKPSLSNLSKHLNANLLVNMSAIKKNKCKHTLKVMEILNTGGLYEGPLEAAQYLLTHIPTSRPAECLKELHNAAKNLLRVGISGNTILSIKQLEEMVLKHYTAKKNKPDAKAWVNACLNQGMANKIWKASGSEPRPNSIIERWENYPNMGRYKIWGIYHFPITAALVNWLNSDDSHGQELLTGAAKRVLMSQVYVDIIGLRSVTQSGSIKDDTGAKYVYTVIDFSDADFEFGSPSGSTNPVGNRIGFKMTATSVKNRGTK